MKKILLFLMVLLASLSAWAQNGIPIDSSNFPDANFRNYLLSRPYGSDGVLTDGEIAAIITISVASKSIADLTGIEHLTALQNLYCDNNQLTELDVSHNTALIFLACSNNSLTELEVSQNTALEALYCNNNQLTELEVRQNTALTQLNCSNIQLAELDVSQNTALGVLDCSNNQLKELDVSQNTAMDVFKCYNNQLTELVVSHNTALWYLYCSGNQINGGNMEALVASLPTVDVDYLGENGSFIVIDLDSETEQNVITTTQVGTARGKNWTVYGLIDDDYQEYAGSEPTYTISLPESFEHGTVTSDKAAASIGETVTLTVTPDDGYELENLTVATVDGEPSGAPLRLCGGSLELTPGENGTYTFEMPAAPVTVNATFKETVVTGVEEINVATAKRGQRYNLMGQPVAGDYKGIVIEDGKKRVIK